MIRTIQSVAWIAVACCSLMSLRAAEPISLHPQNRHYFLFRGKPTVLITSGEHYGAVLNADFNYRRYLKTLGADGFNLTRTFSGAYCEQNGAFRIRNNTLAPKAGRLLSPWKRSRTAGYANGGNRFDLKQWDAAYFSRLKNFVAEAGRNGVVVEFVLFCPFYKERMWNLSPMNARNNVNGIGRVKRKDVYTLKHPALLAAQDAMVRKIVTELNGFDNLYYEICNEPYFGGVTAAWQEHISRTIVQTESTLKTRHLISQNIANKSKTIRKPNPRISIFNFHYAYPPRAVSDNYRLNKVIAENETGFRGSKPDPYRTEGWDFILAGGAVYNNLDYSFICGKEDGSAQIQAPGGGGPVLRKQLRVLKQFIERFDFIHMRPDNGVIISGIPSAATARALVQRGQAYAIYINGGSAATLKLRLPAGTYRAEWINTRTGAVDKTETFVQKGSQRTLTSPGYSRDIALRITRTRSPRR